MSKTKEFNRIAKKATKELKKHVYKTCEWALDGEDQVHGHTNFNDAHSYLMRLVVSKLAHEYDVITNRYYE